MMYSGIKSEGTEVTAGELNKAGYKEVAQKLIDRFKFKKVAITLRTSISANDNKMGLNVIRKRRKLLL